MTTREILTTPELLGVVVGWLLGVVTAFLGWVVTLFVGWARERHRRAAVERAVRTELQESAYRCALTVFAIGRDHGTLNRAALEWVLPEITRYAGPNPSAKVKSHVEQLLALPDESLTAFLRSQERRGPSHLVEEVVVYTPAVLKELHDLSPRFAAGVLDVLAQIRMFNDAAAVVHRFHEHAATAGDDAHAVSLLATSRHAEAEAASRARQVAERIAALNR